MSFLILQTPEHVVKIKGNPTLGLVRRHLLDSKMKPRISSISDIEVWVNEFRLTGLEEKGDLLHWLGRTHTFGFGNISLAGNYSSVGWEDWIKIGRQSY